jgi:PilZ domain
MESEKHDIEFDHRRSAERRSCFLVGGYVMLDKSPYVAKYFDISLEGVGVVTEEPLPANIHVRVALNTKKKGLMLISGKVCWCRKGLRGWRSGIVFDDKLLHELSMII